MGFKRFHWFQTPSQPSQISGTVLLPVYPMRPGETTRFNRELDLL